MGRKALILPRCHPYCRIVRQNKQISDLSNVRYRVRTLWLSPQTKKVERLFFCTGSHRPPALCDSLPIVAFLTVLFRCFQVKINFHHHFSVDIIHSLSEKSKPIIPNAKQFFSFLCLLYPQCNFLCSYRPSMLLLNNRHTCRKILFSQLLIY